MADSAVEMPITDVACSSNTFISELQESPTAVLRFGEVQLALPVLQWS